MEEEYKPFLLEISQSVSLGQHVGSQEMERSRHSLSVRTACI